MRTRFALLAALLGVLAAVGTQPVLAAGAACTVGTCVGDDTTLCLAGDRFRVTAEFDSPNDTGEVFAAAHAEVLTDDSGYLWFFRDTNVEVIIKVLDACAGFDRFWVFAGGLTNVRTTIHVCDTETGVEKIYDNPQGTSFEPIQDTGAFATCD